MNSQVRTATLSWQRSSACATQTGENACQVAIRSSHREQGQRDRSETQSRSLRLSAQGGGGGIGRGGVGMFFGNVNTGLSVCGLSCCGPPAPQSKLWGALDTQHADLSPWCTRGRSNQAGNSPHCIQSLPSRQTGKSKCLPTSTHATECHILLWCVVQVAKVTVNPLPS